MDQILLTTSKLSKIYPGTVALNAVDYEAYEGKVNVLIGENGAGKSTLMKLIAGVETPSSGSLSLRGEKLNITSVKDAEKHNIGIIFQELNLIPYMSVLDNIFLAIEEHHFGHMDMKAQKKKAEKILKMLELDIDLNTMVADLRVGQQQLIEIAKALIKDVNLLIMDEPTSALSATEVEILFRVIEELKEQNVTIIYISHRLEELIRIGDYISILRDGELIVTEKNEDISVDWIVQKMIGEDKKHKERPMRKIEPDAKPVLMVQNLNMYDDLAQQRLKDVSLKMYKGELLGIYGLMGSGRTELFESIFGFAEHVEGEIIFNDQPIEKQPLRKRLHLGMALVPEDRKKQAVIPPLNIRQNMTLASLSQLSIKNLWIQKNKEVEIVNEQIENLSIKTPSGENWLTALSGGNQQKVVIAKSLVTKPKLLLLDECTRGVDVGAKSEIFDIVHDLVDQGGITVAFSSSDLNEIMEHADRIIVMSAGKIAGEFMRSNVTETELVQASAKEL